MTTAVQVLGISNAIVDVLAHVDDQTLEKTGSPKGSMTLVDASAAREIYSLMGPTTEMSGGSVANTIANLSVLGGRAAYIGRVADDEFGKIFIHDMQSLGVDVRMTPNSHGAPTARCHILITPGGERTMHTYLGACIELDSGDVNSGTIGNPEIILLEGYVWDIPLAEVIIDASIRATNENTQLAVSLSDSFCVQRHHQSFADIVKQHAGIVFANEKEAFELFGVDTVNDVIAQASTLDALFVMTRSEHGSIIINGDEQVHQAARPIDRVVDATGAGDAYTAGFLYGYTAGMGLEKSADIATRCATAVIRQVGARVEHGVLED